MFTTPAPDVAWCGDMTEIVTGAGKAARLREVLAGEQDPSRLPSQLIQPSDGVLEWFVDRAAAAGLKAE